MTAGAFMCHCVRVVPRYALQARRSMAAIERVNGSLFTRVAVAQLTQHGALPVPSDAAPLLVEIGTSDRDTLWEHPVFRDQPKAFMLSFEPLLDKYARLLARHPGGGGDRMQPLGFQHERGIALPWAVWRGPIGFASFRVSPNSGCSSLLGVKHDSNRQQTWCKRTIERRAVPTISLDTLIGDFVQRPIELIKLDAQGADLEIVLSANASRSLIRRVSLEVISEDCDVLYDGQPKCVEVVLKMAAIGFEPASPVNCKPRFARSKKRPHLCEIDVLFLNTAAAPPGAGKGVPRRVLPPHQSPSPIAPASMRSFWMFHQLQLNGCHELYELNATKELMHNPPTGKVVLAYVAGRARFFSRQWRGGAKHAFGYGYMCSKADFKPAKTPAKT